MKKIISNILNLNEKLAYNILGKIREFISPFSNMGLKSQENKVSKLVAGNLDIIKKNLFKICPDVTTNQIEDIITENQKTLLIEKANKIMNHQFNILSVDIVFKQEIDWHLDFSSGFRWPKGKLHTKYNQVDTTNNADVKYPRELSRCHHFLYLGQAYLLTKNEKYTDEFINQIEHWIKENPYKKSINWCCSMDIAIRAINWIYGLKMFSSSEKINEGFLSKIFTSLYLHGRYIFENPEKNRSYNHNHYLSDLAGQIVLGLLFKQNKIKETNLWKENGVYEFFREIRTQILPTGFSYERTTNYHRLVTELISYTIIIMKRVGSEIPIDINYRVESMFKVVCNYCNVDGTAPIIGDQDNGRLLPFFPYSFNYQRYLLNIGTVLFDNEFFKSHTQKDNIDILWLFGYTGIEKFNSIKPKQLELKTQSYADAGFYILRSDKTYVFINNSGLSHYNEVVGLGTHTHSDLLSFVYEYEGKSFLVDPGTYLYSANPKQRKKFRSTKMHNTLTVDGYDQNELNEKELWGFSRTAIPSENSFFNTSEVDSFEGAHTGYMRLNDSVLHTRKFELNKVTNELAITDKLECKGSHDITSYFHFDSDVEITLKDNMIECKKEGKKIMLSISGLDNMQIKIIDEYISKSYGERELSKCAVLEFKINGNQSLTTLIKNAE